MLPARDDDYGDGDGDDDDEAIACEVVTDLELFLWVDGG